MSRNAAEHILPSQSLLTTENTEKHVYRKMWFNCRYLFFCALCALCGLFKVRCWTDGYNPSAQQPGGPGL